MTKNHFDVIIDDFLLSDVVNVGAQKYLNKVNPRAVKIISEISENCQESFSSTEKP